MFSGTNIYRFHLSKYTIHSQYKCDKAFYHNQKTEVIFLVEFLQKGIKYSGICLFRYLDIYVQVHVI